MPDAVTINDCLPASSGSKEADDFINQQAGLIPHNPQARGKHEREAADDINSPRTQSQSEQSTEASNKTDSHEGNQIIPTTPPKNDMQDKTLHSGDREVIFVGT